MILTFTFPLPPTLNKTINSARTNKFQSARDKKLWTNWVASQVIGQPKFTGKVWVEFYWQVANIRRDPDNISAAAKPILDGLVLAKIIKGDSLAVIQSPYCHYFEVKPGEPDIVTIKISDEKYEKQEIHF